jgi:uncharacterized protein (DUF58 family)
MTTRAKWFIFASFLFYFFANQTQVGWVYVISGLLLAIVLIAWVWNRGILRSTKITRHVTSHPIEGIASSNDLYENQDIDITIQVSGAGIPQVNLIETCPLADPQGENHSISMYIPYLPNNGVNFTYQTPVYRRGLATFPAVQLMSRAPFGFFKREKSLDVPYSTLVFPEVKPLKRLILLDRQPTAQMSYPRVGVGNEVLGVREFKQGDSPRHIHWRTVARRGVLMTKEFAEETQEGMTLFLDRYAPYDNTITKYTSFEMGIKCAVSVAEYAFRRRFMLYLATKADDFAHPHGALTWDGFLQYMAKVPPANVPHLHELLTRTQVQQFVVAVLSWADLRVAEPLIALQRRGIHCMVVLMDTNTFPNMPENNTVEGLSQRLQSVQIPVYTIKHGDEWDTIIAS